MEPACFEVAKVLGLLTSPTGLLEHRNATEATWYRAKRVDRRMAKSPEDGMSSLIKNLEEKTGKSLTDWVSLARKTGLAKHKELVAHLKADHGLTHGYANQVALHALAADNAPTQGSDDQV